IKMFRKVSAQLLTACLVAALCGGPFAAQAGQSHHSVKGKATSQDVARAVQEGAGAGSSEGFTQQGPLLQHGRTVWEYRLVISETEHRLADGSRYKVWAYGGRVPGPTLVAREGDWIRITLVNESSASHTIHSHGLFVPHRMDGVPHS